MFSNEDDSVSICGLRLDGSISCKLAYINDPLYDMDTNVKVVWSGNQCKLIATRVIEPGEELLIAYGFGFWMDPLFPPHLLRQARLNYISRRSPEWEAWDVIIQESERLHAVPPSSALAVSPVPVPLSSWDASANPLAVFKRKLGPAGFLPYSPPTVISTAVPAPVVSINRTQVILDSLVELNSRVIANDPFIAMQRKFGNAAFWSQSSSLLPLPPVPTPVSTLSDISPSSLPILSAPQVVAPVIASSFYVRTYGSAFLDDDPPTYGSAFLDDAPSNSVVQSPSLIEVIDLVSSDSRSSGGDGGSTVSECDASVVSTDF